MLNKPINPSPHNVCVGQNHTFEYEIPNNETIDGAYTYWTRLDTGEIQSDVYSTFDTPTQKVSEIRTNLAIGDYAWSSFYWKNPTVDGEKHIIIGADSTTHEIIIKPKGETAFNESLYKSTTRNDDYSVVELGMVEGYPFEFTEEVYENSGSSQYRKYIGHPCFCVTRGSKFCDELSKEIGSRIVELYDTNNILLGRTKILAIFNQIDTRYYDPVTFFIVDNVEFCNAIQTLPAYRSTYNDPTMIFYEFGRVKIYREIDLVPSVESGSLLRHLNSYYTINSIRNVDYNSMLSIAPDISVSFGDEIEVWTSKTAEFNTSPAYYFRVKNPPTTLNISATSTLFTSNVDEGNTLSDIKCNFKVEYASDYKLNYFYLYCYVLNKKTYEWELKERSPMLFNINESYEFACFVPGQEYKVCAVCVDKDGDEWTTEDVEFTTEISYTELSEQNVIFNKKDTTVDVYLRDILSSYKTVSLDFYKISKNDITHMQHLIYAGGGTAKSDNLTLYDRWRDYNIRNDAYYDYYIRVSYVDESDVSGIVFSYIPNVHTEFEGTSILGLKEMPDSKLVISNTFNLMYHFNKDLGEIINEISREYIGTFGKYPKELKGHQNYISSSCSGLLGDEKDGIYAEPKGIRNTWIDFVNDDTIKFYRGVDGITAVISIESSRIKPYNYPNVGIVNEVYMTYKEIAPIEQYAIFTTE